MESWYKNPAYQELAHALREQDSVRQMGIIAEQIASLTGAEKAFWLVVRSNLRTTLPVPAWDVAWSDLEAARQVAPDDPEVRRLVLRNGLGMAVATEKMAQFRALAAGMGRDYLGMRRDYILWPTLGTMHLARRRWGPAYRNWSRAVAGLESSSPERRSANVGWLSVYLGRRAIAAIGCGKLEQARLDVARAFELRGPALAKHYDYMQIGLPKAELAYAEGRLQDARAALQEGLTRNAAVGKPKLLLHLQIQTDLLAARIARAEGNQEGFRHFCTQALGPAEANGLAWTAERVRAVEAGAEL